MVGSRVGISRYIAKFGEGDTTLAMEDALSGEEHSSISLCVFFAHAHITLRASHLSVDGVVQG